MDASVWRSKRWDWSIGFHHIMAPVHAGVLSYYRRLSTIQQHSKLAPPIISTKSAGVFLLDLVNCIALLGWPVPVTRDRRLLTLSKYLRGRVCL